MEDGALETEVASKNFVLNNRLSPNIDAIKVYMDRKKFKHLMQLKLAASKQQPLQMQTIHSPRT